MGNLSMGVVEIVAELAVRGVQMQAVGYDRLRFEPGPPAELRGVILAHKSELLQLVGGYPPIPGREAASRHWAADPRSDLADDSAHWLALLRIAWVVDGRDPNGVFGVLRGLRCLGARLTRGGEGCEWRIIPPPGVSERGLVVEWLEPHAPLAVDLLTRLDAPDEEVE